MDFLNETMRKNKLYKDSGDPVVSADMRLGRTLFGLVSVLSLFRLFLLLGTTKSQPIGRFSFDQVKRLRRPWPWMDSNVMGDLWKFDVLRIKTRLISIPEVRIHDCQNIKG